MSSRYDARLLFLCVLLFTSSLSKAQSGQPIKPMDKHAHPAFEVATVKPHDPSSSSQGFNVEGDRMSIRNETVVGMLMVAYSVHRSQIDGLPNWAHDHWDIDGTTDTPGEPDVRQQQEMLQKLLVERFGLKFHHAQRELPVYLLQLAKGGSKLKPASKPDLGTGQEASGNGSVATFNYTSTDMSDFILGETPFVDRPLLDQTGLTGRYDFSLRYTFKEGAPTDDPNAPPGLFTAVQDQLGLKLTPAKAPIQVMVIDHLDPPSAN